MRLVVALLIGAALGVGVAMSVSWQPAPIQIACRPSLPQIATKDTDKPVVLFWGNSLLFDHGWDDPAFMAVNCARQGLTAAQAREMTPNLPVLPVDAVLVALGSVELARDVARAPEGFEGDIRAIVTALRAQYPEGRIFLSGVPEGDGDWIYAGSAVPGQLNGVLQAVEGTTYFDLTAALAGVEAAAQSYDGLHLTRESYALWQSGFARLLGAD